MEQKQHSKSFVDRLDGGLKSLERVREHTSFLYLFMFVVTVLGIAFFAFSRNLFADDSQIVDSGVGQSSISKIGDSDIMIVSRKINKSSGYGEVIIRIDSPITEVGTEYEAAAGESKQKQLVNAKVEKIYDQYYLIKLKEIPKNWRQLVIDFGYTSSEKPRLNINYDSNDLEEFLNKKEEQTAEKTEQITFVFDYREIDDDSKLKEQSAAAYIIEVTEIEIQNVKEKIELIEKNQEKVRKEVGLLDKKITEIEQEMNYQTEDQMIVSKANIETIKNQITQYEDSIVKGNAQKEKLEEKRELLITRYHDADIENEK